MLPDSSFSSSEYPLTFLPHPSLRHMLPNRTHKLERGPLLRAQDAVVSPAPAIDIRPASQILVRCLQGFFQSVCYITYSFVLWQPLARRPLSPTYRARRLGIPFFLILAYFCRSLVRGSLLCISHPQIASGQLQLGTVPLTVAPVPNAAPLVPHTDRSEVDRVMIFFNLLP